MNSMNKPGSKPTTAAIEKRAYELWEKDGRKPGHSDKYWMQAEQELLAASQSAEPAKAAPETKLAASPKAPVATAVAAVPTPKPSVAAAPKPSVAPASKPIVTAPQNAVAASKPAKPAKPATKRSRTKSS